MLQEVAAMALIGGRGSRMDILCKARPKPNLPMLGSYRLIDFTLSNCIRSEIPSLGLIGDYLHEEAFAYLEKWRQQHRLELDLAFLRPESGNYQGTADAVYRNLDHLAGPGGKYVLLLAGDHVYNMDYREMLECHKRARADVTIGVARVPRREVQRYGRVTLGTDRRIVEFVEKPGQSEGNLVSMGIYIFNRSLLRQWLEGDAREKASCHDFGYSILPRLVKEAKVVGFEYPGYWRDIGTVESYYQGNMDLLGIFARSSEGAWQVYSVNPGFSPVPLNSGSIKDSLLGRDCMIYGRVEHSILGDRVVVDSGAVVRDSIILDDSYVGVDSEVLTSVVDEKVCIGSESIIGYFSAGLSGPLEISVVGRMVNLPSHCIVGKHCTIIPTEPGNSEGIYNVEGRQAVSS